MNIVADFEQLLSKKLGRPIEVGPTTADPENMSLFKEVYASIGGARQTVAAPEHGEGAQRIQPAAQAVEAEILCAQPVYDDAGQLMGQAVEADLFGAQPGIHGAGQLLRQALGADLLGGGSSVGPDHDIRKSLLKDSQFAVFRPKIMAPHADTMGFIDREERKVRLLQEIEKAVGEESFR